MKYILFILLIATRFAFANEIQENTESIIKAKFGVNVSITFMKYKIPIKVKSEIEASAQQRFFSDQTFIWSIKRGDSLVAVGIMDNVYGKAQPITFITFFRLDGEILSNHIVKYREEHGGAVSNEDWNKQFIGMNKDSDFNKVDAISGATISVNAMKKGVLKLVLLFKTLNRKEL